MSVHQLVYYFIVGTTILKCIRPELILPKDDNGLFLELDTAESCLTGSSPTAPSCKIYKLKDAVFDFECLAKNVISIKGEYEILKIICSATYPIDFRYFGIQSLSDIDISELFQTIPYLKPTEALSVEWYKEIQEGTNASITSFNVEVRISSVEALYQFFSKQSKEPILRHDYSRTGNYEFQGIFRRNETLDLFLYLEDSAQPSFLRNSKTKPTIAQNLIHFPCISSHWDKKITIERINPPSRDSILEKFVRQKSTTFQGFNVDITGKDVTEFYGVYKCTLLSTGTDSVVLDLLSMNLTSPLGEELRFGLGKPIRKELGQAIRYESQVDNQRNIQIQISCKVHKLGDPTFLSAIEVENYAAMNLKREFTFPKFINRSYSAQVISTVGELSFQVKLPNVFQSRWGGASFCESGDSFEVEEFAVPFVGDVSKRLFDTNWIAFKREKSNIRIHFEISVLKNQDGANSDDDGVIYSNTNVTFECKFITAIVVKPAIWYTVWKNGSVVEEMLDYEWKGKLRDSSYFTKMMSADVKAGYKPEIHYPVEKQQSLRLNSINQVLTCKARGRPTPAISWMKDGKTLPGVKTPDGSILYQIPIVDNGHGGEYFCLASNVYGEDKKAFVYEITEEPGTNYGLIIGLMILAILLTLIGAIVYVKFFRVEKIGLTKAEVQEFLAGEQRLMMTEGDYAHEFAQYRPYDKAYELPLYSFQIDRTSVIGSGAFGMESV